MTRDIGDCERVRPPVLVVGTGRCGSTLLSNLLRAHPEVLSLSELFTALVPRAFPEGDLTGTEFWEILSVPGPLAAFLARHEILPGEVLYNSGSGQRRFGNDDPIPPICLTTLPHLVDDPDALYDELRPVVTAFPVATVGEHYRRLFAWLAGRFGRPAVVERSGASLAYLDQVWAAFPDARYVHVVRDGPACALSMRDHHAFRMLRISARMEKALGFDPYLAPRPYDLESVPAELHPLLPDRFDRDVYLSFPMTGEEFGWIWSAMILAGLRVLKQMSADQVHVLRYEDLLSEPKPTLDALAEFMGLEGDREAWIADASAMVRAPSRREPLPQDDAERLLRATGTATRYLRRFDERRARGDIDGVKDPPEGRISPPGESERSV